MSGADREGRSGIFRKPKNDPKEANKIKNVFMNAILPLKGGKLIKGSLIYVVLEVAVSKLLRRISGATNVSIPQLAFTHLISLGVMGGVSASMTGVDEDIIPYGTKSMKQHIKQGLKGVPALYLAQYIVYCFYHGLYNGQFSMREAMITMAAKVLTRPIASKIYPSMKFAQNAFDAQQLMEEHQMLASNFGRIPQGDLYVKKGNEPNPPPQAQGQ
jgi:hypothetical protein